MDHSIIRKAKEFVESHLSVEYSLDEFAQFVGYSSYHFTREFKELTGQTAMEYIRERRLLSAAEDITHGNSICGTAMKYCFDTHAGFTKAFTTLFGCTPKEFQAHAKMPNMKGMMLMDGSKIVIRPVCTDDVQDLWENVYSAMTPRQITEVKILPSIEKEKRREGIHLVAQVDGRVVMALPMDKPYWLPIGFLFDNNYVSDGGDHDIIMSRMLDEMKKVCKMMNISMLIAPEYENSESSRSFCNLGFMKMYTSGGWDYLMMSIQ